MKSPDPDVIIIFGNSHDILVHDLNTIGADLQRLVDIVNSSVRHETRIMWVPLHGHYRPLLPEGERYIEWDELHALNQVWFDVLKPVVSDARSNMIAFFDLQALSKDVLPKWIVGVGRAHLVDDWYDRIVSYILQTVCS